MALADTLRLAVADMPDVRLAVLFGSEATGAARAGSDLDVGLLLTPGAERTPSIAVALERACGREVDVIWLDEAPPLLRFEIARDGIVLVERTPYLWAGFRAHAMIDWWDWQPTARMMHRVAAARLQDEAGRGQDPSAKRCTILDADASRRASLLVAYIRPVCALLAPRRASASTPRDGAPISGRALRRDVVTANAGPTRAWLNDAASLLTPGADWIADATTRDVSIFYLLPACRSTLSWRDRGWRTRFSSAPASARSTASPFASRPPRICW
jgi:uncharacterized protein